MFPWIPDTPLTSTALTAANTPAGLYTEYHVAWEDFGATDEMLAASEQALIEAGVVFETGERGPEFDSGDLRYAVDISDRSWGYRVTKPTAD